MSTQLLDRPKTTDTGNPDGLAHYTRKDGIVDAMVDGTTLLTFCGIRIVPSRDPERYPVCPACKEVFDSLPES
jgi:hypothetical protein